MTVVQWLNAFAKAIAKHMQNCINNRIKLVSCYCKFTLYDTLCQQDTKFHPKISTLCTLFVIRATTVAQWLNVFVEAIAKHKQNCINNKIKLVSC